MEKRGAENTERHSLHPTSQKRVKPKYKYLDYMIYCVHIWKFSVLQVNYNKDPFSGAGSFDVLVIGT